MFQKEHKADWIVLFIIGILLFFLYGFNIEEMFKRVLEVAFTWTGYRLIVDYSLTPKINQALNKIE